MSLKVILRHIHSEKEKEEDFRYVLEVPLTSLCEVSTVEIIFHPLFILSV